jgi:hypothetical protein
VPATPRTVPKPAPSEIDAFIACEMEMERRLRAPSTAHFADMWDADLAEQPVGAASQLTDRIWITHSYVDAQNGFGAMLRTHFSCRVEYPTGDRDVPLIAWLDTRPS